MPREPIDITKLKPSELLRLAVQDAQKCEAMPDVYALRMGSWHDPDRVKGKCAVCMAGAIIAQTLQANPRHYADPEDFNREIRDQLELVDSLRCGDVFLDEINGPDLERAKPALEFISREYDPDLAARRAPWPVYLEAADMLEKAGL